MSNILESTQVYSNKYFTLCWFLKKHWFSSFGVHILWLENDGCRSQEITECCGCSQMTAVVKNTTKTSQNQIQSATTHQSVMPPKYISIGQVIAIALHTILYAPVCLWMWCVTLLHQHTQLYSNIWQCCGVQKKHSHLCSCTQTYVHVCKLVKGEKDEKGA